MLRNIFLAAFIFFMSAVSTTQTGRADTPFDGMIGVYEGIWAATPAEIVADGAEYAILYYRSQTTAYVSSWLDDAATVGLKVALELPIASVESGDTAAIQAFISNFDSKSALVAWYMYDEPDSDMDDECFAVYNAIKAVSSKPVCIAFFGTSNIVSIGGDSCDFILWDCYPIALNDDANWSLCDRGALWWFEEGFQSKVDDAWEEIQDAGKNWIMVAQAYGWNSTYEWNNRLPTRDENKFMHYYPMVRNCKSVCYWSRSMCLSTPALTSKPYPWSGITWLRNTDSNGVFQQRRTEMAVIGDAFDNGATADAVTDNKTRIYSRFHQLDNGDCYICLLNRTYVDENVTVSVNVSGYTRVQLMFEDTSPIYTLNSSNEFTYTMTDFKVKWFKLLP